MSKIFLSYRRQESAGVAGRIYDRLRAHFGNDAIFMVIDSPFGVDFREHISSAIDQCGVVWPEGNPAVEPSRSGCPAWRGRGSG